MGKYFGSTKYYELIQENDSISVLSGITDSIEEDIPACDDICLNENGDVVVSYDNTINDSSCVIGSGWFKVKNYTLDTCSSLDLNITSSISTDAISTNQTLIEASLLEQEATTGTTDELNAIVESVMTTSTSSNFPTFAPNTQTPITTDPNIPAPAEGYATTPVSPTNSTVSTKSTVNTNVIILLVFSVAVSA